MATIRNTTRQLPMFIFAVLFTIQSVAQITGKSINSATFMGMSLFKTSGGKWAVADSVTNKPIGYISEIKRDENFIYLWVEQTNDDVTIDINQKTLLAPEREDTIKRFVNIKFTSWHEETIITGWTVNRVTTGSGSFYKSTENKWIEADLTGKPIGFFTETNRDQWSVYLLKDDGNELRIDLYLKSTFFIPKGEKQFELYKLTGWENEMMVSGYTINSVNYGKSSLFKTTTTDWVGTDTTGKAIANFKELLRNDTSVFLLKPDSSLLRIDVNGKKVFSAPNKEKESPLYLLSGWSNEVPENGFTVNQVSSGKILFFYQPRGYWALEGNVWVFKTSRWIETDSTKKPFAFFTEKSRDLNSVLLQKDDGLMLRISLPDKMIYLKTANDKEQAQYPISDVKKDHFVNGWTVNKVTFQSGALIKKEEKKWVETDASGKETGHFTETSRDEWSVFLLKDDGHELRIDLYLKSTFFTTKGEKPFELYKLTGWFNL